MITSDDLAALRIQKIIFHDVPHRPRGMETEPRLSEVPTAFNATQREHLHKRVTRALSSKSAYGIEFDPKSASPLPDVVRECAAQSNTKTFVARSQDLARYLHEQQVGTVSPGLLAVVKGVASGFAVVGILKLEREEGAQLEFDEEARTFSMDVLENLVLTDGTKLFKSALFINCGKGANDFRAAACDNQRGFGGMVEVARFWMRFLGCRLTVEPHIATKRFYEAAIEYIANDVTEPTLKHDLYEHVVSELTSQKARFSPTQFIEDYFPSEHRDLFRGFLQERGLGMNTFPLDISEISAKLRRRSYGTKNGVRVVVPEECAEIVEVTEEKITVHDELSTVS